MNATPALKCAGSRRAQFASSVVAFATWVLIAWSAHAEAPTTGSVPLLQEQERSHELIEPPDLMRTGVGALQTAGYACRGDVAVRRGSEVRVTLSIGYSDHTMWNPDTQQDDKVHLRTYNGCLTGPTLTVHPSDTLIVNLKNELPPSPAAECPQPINTPDCYNSGNLHTHGLHVSPAGNSDNVLISIDPGKTFPYRYDIPSSHPSGTFWYHSHRHGSTALSVTSGMEGVLIVRGERRYADRAQNQGVADVDTILHDAAGHAFPERVLLFQQIAYGCFSDPAFQNLERASDGKWICGQNETGVVENYLAQFGFAPPPGGGAPQDVWPQSGRFTAVNGKVQPVFEARAGQIERWRMVHGGVRDTINLQIVKATNPPPVAANPPPTSTASAAGPGFTQLLAVPMTDAPAAATQLRSLSREQLAQFVNQNCGGDVTLDTTQYEVAQDGLTRHKITPKQLNILNPGQRSDALVFFRDAGIYCVLDQTGSEANTIIRQGGRLGSKSRSLLAVVVVSGGHPVNGAADAYLASSLSQANADLPSDVRTALGKLDVSAFAFSPPSSPGSDLQNATIAGHPSSLFELLPVQTQPTPPDQPAQNPAIAAVLGRVQNASLGSDPLPYSHNTTYQALLGTVDEWTLGVFNGPAGSIAAPHVFHIHVNPFQVMDIKGPNGSIFDSSGGCVESEKTNSPEYCDELHVFRDTIFVKPGYQVVARTAYDDFIGEYVLHCHILDHEDQGMMQNVTIISSPNEEPVAQLASQAQNQPAHRH